MHENNRTRLGTVIHVEDVPSYLERFVSKFQQQHDQLINPSEYVPLFSFRSPYELSSNFLNNNELQIAIASGLMVFILDHDMGPSQSGIRTLSIITSKLQTFGYPVQTNDLSPYATAFFLSAAPGVQRYYREFSKLESGIMSEVAMQALQLIKTASSNRRK
jgi:hypothetical protein